MLESKRLSQSREEQAAEAAGQTAADPAVVAAAFSVALSWYFFFGRGDRERGLFVALWPPTILAFASYFNQTRMSEKIETVVHGGSANVIQTIEQMMRNR